MTDELAGLDGLEAPASVPAVTAADIEKVKAELMASFDERAKGFQRLISEKDKENAALMEKLQELSLAGLSEEEREELEDRAKDTRIEELEARLELQALAKDYGTEMPYFERLIDAASTEDQLKVMREFAEALKPAPQAQPEAPIEPEVDVPDVDLNRPMRRFTPGVVGPDGKAMTDELADRILGSMTGRQASVTQVRR